MPFNVDRAEIRGLGSGFAADPMGGGIGRVYGGFCQLSHAGSRGRSPSPVLVGGHMSNAFASALINLTLSVGILLGRGDVIACAYAIASVALLGLVIVLESRSDKRLEALKAELKEINNRIDGLNLSKGFGR